MHMEAVRPHEDDGPEANPAGARTHDCDTHDSRALEALVGLVADAPLADDLLDRAVEQVADLFGLSGVTLSLVREVDDVMHVQPVASGGAHAAFARDMSSRPLDALADAATAVSEGRPIFVGDAYGAGDTPAEETGVGRWRSTISAHATGVLPVRAWGRTVGVLTVEWPSARPLGDKERGLLEAASSLLGVMVAALGEREADEQSADIVEQPHEVVALYGVTPEGVVVPLSGGDVPGAAPVLTLSVAMRAGIPGEHPVWDVTGVSARTVVATAGVAIAPAEDAEALAAAVGEAMRSYAAQGVRLGNALTYLGHAVRARAASGSRASVTGFSIELLGASAAVTCASAGAVMSLALASDGRLAVQPSGQPALSGSSATSSAERHSLLLDGDRLAVLGGQVAPLDTSKGRSAARRVLDAAGPDGTEAARELLGMLDGPGRAGIAVVIQKVGPASPG